MLILGVCFHTSFQKFTISEGPDLGGSLALVQYSANSDKFCVDNNLLCLLHADTQDFDHGSITTDYNDNLPHSESDTYIDMYSEEKDTKGVEDVGLVIADILTIVSRVIIALTGAIFGTRQVLRKLE
jgi:hypothetical protein